MLTMEIMNQMTFSKGSSRPYVGDITIETVTTETYDSETEPKRKLRQNGTRYADFVPGIRRSGFKKHRRIAVRGARK